MKKERKSKNHVQSILPAVSAFCILLAVFTACKIPHQREAEQAEIELVLESINIHDIPADTVSWGVEVPKRNSRVTKENIKAEFNLPGINISVKGEEIILIQGQAVQAVLDAAPVKGKHKAWTKSITGTQKTTEETELKKLLDTVLINGGKTNSFPQDIYKSAAYKKISLPDAGKTINIKLEPFSKGRTAKADFKIERIEGTIDIPSLSLQINQTKYTPQNKDIRRKLRINSMPEFESSEPVQIKIECEQDLIGYIRINNSDIGTIKNYGNIWYGESSVTGLTPSGKNIKVEIIPKDPANYNSVIWNFKLKYVESEKMNIEYAFNGKFFYDLDADFVNALLDRKDPKLSVDGNFLNPSLYCRDSGGEAIRIKINDTEYINKIKKEDIGWSLHVSVKLEGENQITAVTEPKNKEKFGITAIGFRAQDSSQKEKIKIREFSINGLTGLPKETFLNKLEDNSNPLYQVYGEKPVKLGFTVDGYQGIFNISKLIINNENMLLKKDNIHLNYKAEKDIIINKTTPVNVVIQFVPKKPGMTETVIMKFRLQGGGKLPSIPRNFIPKFYVNRIGSSENPFPAEFSEKLTEESNPQLLSIEGHNAEIFAAVYTDNKAGNNGVLKEVGFILDGGAETKKNLTKTGYPAEVTHTLEFLEDGSEHLIKIIMSPKQEETYSELSYVFKVKDSGIKPELPLKFTINGNKYINGKKTFFSKNRVTLAAEAEKDAKTNGETFQNAAYGEIEINKTKLNEGKLYLAFGIWKETSGFTLDTGFAYHPYQQLFEKLNESGNMQWYKTVIDVSTLTEGTGLDVNLPILNGDAACFAYKVKIRQTPFKS